MTIRPIKKLEGPWWEAYPERLAEAERLAGGDRLARFTLLFPDGFVGDPKPFHPPKKEPIVGPKEQFTLAAKGEEPMPIIATGTTAKRNPAPAGLHSAVCVDVQDLGIKHNEKFDKDEHKIRLIWELEEQDPDFGQPYTVAQSFNLTLKTNSAGVPSKLRATLEAWRGRAFTDEELKGFDVETVIGAPCLVNISHNESGGNTYANVGSVVAYDKRFKRLTPSPGYIRAKDRPTDVNIEAAVKAAVQDEEPAEAVPF